MNLHRDALSSKQNFSKNSISRCKCTDCLEKKVFFSNNTAVLKSQTKRMIIKVTSCFEEIVIRKSCLGILAICEGLVSFFKVMNLSLRLKLLINKNKEKEITRIKEHKRPLYPCKILKAAHGPKQLTY